MLKSNKSSRWFKVKVLFIDNFDSFTYNLVDEFKKRDCEVLVYRNNVDLKIISEAVKKFKPDLIVISPGPGNPKQAGNSIQIIQDYHQKIPIFGVCLGLQCMVEAFGGAVGKAPETIHGKPSKITHDGQTIFKDLASPLQVGRYHSLCATDVPFSFEVSSRGAMNLVMSIRHKEFPVEGVQFHPESILTPAGGLMIENLIKEVSKK